MNIIINNDKMVEYEVGKREERILLFLECGDFKVFYSPKDKTYLVKRKDNQCFDGTESLNIQVYGNMKLPNTTEEKLEYIIGNFTGLQGIKYDKLFNEFDYKINSDNNEIIIYPFYLDNTKGYAINIETPLDKKIGNMMVACRTEKKCRKLIK